MVFFLAEIFFFILFINIIVYFTVQCTSGCKKFFKNTNEPSVVTKTVNLFGAHNKKVANEITAVRPSNCISMQPEIIQPAESVRTKKEEEIAKGNVFTKKDNHPTFEDIVDDWEPSIEEIKATGTGSLKANGINQKRLFKPPKPENSYTKKSMPLQSLKTVNKKDSDNNSSKKNSGNNSPKKVSNNNSSKKDSGNNSPKKVSDNNSPKKVSDDNLSKKANDDNSPKKANDNNLSKEVSDNNLLKKITDNNISKKVPSNSSKTDSNEDCKRPQPSKIARTLREEEIARGERKTISAKDEPTLEEVLDDWG